MTRQPMPSRGPRFSRSGRVPAFPKRYRVLLALDFLTRKGRQMLLGRTKILPIRSSWSADRLSRRRV